MSLPPRMLAALAATAERLDAAGIEWLLAGGAGRALGGFAVRPADLDIEVAAHGAPAAARALGIELTYRSDGGRSSWRGAGAAAGVAIDLTSELEVEGPQGRLAPDFALQRTWARSVEVCGRRIWLAPVGETIARAIVSADWGTLARVAAEARDAAVPVHTRPAYLSLRLSSAIARASR